MTSSRRSLRLVSYDPEDYSLGSALVGERFQVIDSPKDVAAALSLYFQWPEHRSAVLVQADDLAGFGTLCELDYDRDEREPSELRLRLGDEARALPSAGASVQIRFEIFRTSYELAVAVLAVSEDPASDGWHLIIEAPSTLRSLKHRRLPRVRLGPDEAPLLAPVSWRTANGKECLLQVLEIGFGSMVVGKIAGVEGPGTLILGDQDFEAHVMRATEETLVLRAQFRDGREAGRYFDLYRAVAYPRLVPRQSVDAEAVLRIYEETNYFGKFVTGETLADRKSSIAATWSAIAGGTHESTADYVSLDDDGKLAGASSASIAYKNAETTYWTFHQLCARTKPDLLEASGCLYTWRAEYLAGRPEPLKVLGWFDSRSRWLERIYVKFCLQRGIEGRLLPVRVVRRSFDAPEGPGNSVPSHAMALGEARRVCIAHNGVLAAASPAYLNASGVLDSVLACLGPSQPDDVERVARALVAALGLSTARLEVTLPGGADDAAGEPVVDVDRFFLLDKEDLVDFLASVEHSIAVTRKKIAAGRHVR